MTVEALSGPRSPSRWLAAALATTLALVAACSGTLGTEQPTTPSATFPAPSPAQASPETPASPSTAPSSSPEQPLASPATSPEASMTAMASAAATPGASPPPAGGGSWQQAGSMHVSRALSRAVVLPDGRVLVVGNDGLDFAGVRDDSASAELWDPSTNAWQTLASLNQPRASFGAVALRDGRVLVTGGLARGVPGSGADPGSACIGTKELSYSSTYLYDPRSGSQGWVRSGLLATARTDPSIAVLPDGRVLVAGGFYVAGTTGQAPAAGALAAYHPGAAGSTQGGPPHDIGPNFTVPPLATAELFDPSTSTWSATGPMHYARFDAAIAVLPDGRVLVAGSRQGTWLSGGGEVLASDHALDTAEIYDPRTGTFALTGELPAQDRRSGAYGAIAGSLAALPDGGALLAGNERDWKHGGYDVRSFRFDAAAGAWSEVGRGFLMDWNAAGTLVESPGVGARANAMVATLPDGRVLAAGGDAFTSSGPSASRAAALFDPATNQWSALPSLPDARAGGAAVTLPDGSVLLVGGYNDQRSAWADCNEPLGLASAIRFVPSR